MEGKGKVRRDDDMFRHYTKLTSLTPSHPLTLEQTLTKSKFHRISTYHPTT